MAIANLASHSAGRFDAAPFFTIGEFPNNLVAAAILGNTHETIARLHDSFALLFCRLFSGHASKSRAGATKGFKEMGRCQTETSYLESVLLWLQEYWTGPAVRIYPLRAVSQEPRRCSAGRTYAALNQRDVIIDLPAFLPLRKSQNMASRHREIRPRVA